MARAARAEALAVAQNRHPETREILPSAPIKREVHLGSARLVLRVTIRVVKNQGNSDAQNSNLLVVHFKKISHLKSVLLVGTATIRATSHGNSDAQAPMLRVVHSKRVSHLRNVPLVRRVAIRMVTNRANTDVQNLIPHPGLFRKTSLSGSVHHVQTAIKAPINHAASDVPTRLVTTNRGNSTGPNSTTPNHAARGANRLAKTIAAIRPRETGPLKNSTALV